MAKRKRIKLRQGCQIKLAKDCGVGVATVRRALQWERDSDIQNLIRNERTNSDTSDAGNGRYCRHNINQT